MSLVTSCHLWGYLRTILQMRRSFLPLALNSLQANFHCIKYYTRWCEQWLYKGTYHIGRVQLFDCIDECNRKDCLVLIWTIWQVQHWIMNLSFWKNLSLVWSCCHKLIQMLIYIYIYKILKGIISRYIVLILITKCYA